jgi:ElaA protein
MAPVHLYDRSFAELDAATLYALLRLRVDVFVVEQACPYPELDGRDLEPTTRHLWLAEASTPTSSANPAEPLAYLRVLAEADGTARIGRVCTAVNGRGRGLSRRLMTAALQRVGERPCVLDAQSYLVDFYRSFGFIDAGPEFLEDGIPHIPMRRDGSGPS